MRMIRKMLRPGLKRKILRMRLVLLLSSLAFLFLAISACDQRSTTYVTGEDHTPPPVPSGVTTITGDGVVWVLWNRMYGVPDLAGFRIWRGRDNIEFFLIATVGANAEEYADYDVTNGITYYYGITAFDDDGNESDASFDHDDFAFDTPRPEGTAIIYDSYDPDYEYISGFDFSFEERVHWNSSRCDIFLEYYPDPGLMTYFIVLGNNGLHIQDMGYTDDFDEITYAPDDGWSSLDYAEAIEGHTYVIQTANNNYAKVRVTAFSDTFPDRWMEFDWGYQIDPGNRELKIEPPNDMDDMPEEQVSQ
jgi:hypothetical protein